jgi:Fe-S cluster assembly protein SufD
LKIIKVDLTIKEQTIEVCEDSEIVGIFVGKGDSKISTILNVVHKQPNLRSLTTIKAVVFDNSTFDMTGNLVILKGAKNTDAYLRLDALMMSPTAKARVVPGLEITENDVKGGHGATVGRVNQEQLFYLISRGISKKNAEELLVEGFLANILIKL